MCVALMGVQGGDPSRLSPPNNPSGNCKGPAPPQREPNTTVSHVWKENMKGVRGAERMRGRHTARTSPDSRNVNKKVTGRGSQAPLLLLRTRSSTDSNNISFSRQPQDDLTLTSSLSFSLSTLPTRYQPLTTRRGVEGHKREEQDGKKEGREEVDRIGRGQRNAREINDNLANPGH